MKALWTGVYINDSWHHHLPGDYAGEVQVFCYFIEMWVMGYNGCPAYVPKQMSRPVNGGYPSGNME